ncbi:hypothetical protein L6164_036488 [Bauhinia variegata]|uniref:Uncharacterized protein n=1 Tax=Bauhinia variegata TaxID=167791 RepID=A0ACB9KH64_BAUVA|nr:hypothetical protein L6164_036488 [Bauhinia variegata]
MNLWMWVLDFPRGSMGELPPRDELEGSRERVPTSWAFLEEGLIELRDSLEGLLVKIRRRRLSEDINVARVSVRG